VINTEQNQGLSYAFDEVVRRKDERKSLTGGQCEQCKEVCIFLVYFTTIFDVLYGSSTIRTSLHYLQELRAHAGVHVLLITKGQHLIDPAAINLKVKAERVRLRSTNSESPIIVRPGLPLRTRQTIG
jgi:hypothetical protein